MDPHQRHAINVALVFGIITFFTIFPRAIT